MQVPPSKARCDLCLKISLSNHTHIKKLVTAYLTVIVPSRLLFNYSKTIV